MVQIKQVFQSQFGTTLDAMIEVSLFIFTQHIVCYYSWSRGTVVERGTLTGELSLFCTRLAADR